MPTYEYQCAACGPFQATRPMSEFKTPQPCAGCGVAAPRVIRSAPHLAGMHPARREAAAINERSANAPTRFAGTHPASCGCCKPGKAGLSAETVPLKSSAATRPWMIGH